MWGKCCCKEHGKVTVGISKMKMAVEEENYFCFLQVYEEAINSEGSIVVTEQRLARAPLQHDGIFLTLKCPFVRPSGISVLSAVGKSGRRAGSFMQMKQHKVRRCYFGENRLF